MRNKITVLILLIICGSTLYSFHKTSKSLDRLQLKQVEILASYFEATAILNVKLDSLNTHLNSLELEINRVNLDIKNTTLDNEKIFTTYSSIIIDRPEF